MLGIEPRRFSSVDWHNIHYVTLPCYKVILFCLFVIYGYIWSSPSISLLFDVMLVWNKKRKQQYSFYWIFTIEWFILLCKIEWNNKKHDSTVNRTRVLTVLMSHSTIKLWNLFTWLKTMLLVRIELTTLCLLNTRSTTELKKRCFVLFVCYIWV